MADVQEILQSPEMREVVRAINVLRRKYTLHQTYVTDHEWPVAIARVGRFRAGMVAQILLGNEHYYPGYREVLTGAFAGWLLAPKSREIREALMTRSALDYMDGANRRVGSDGELTLEKDVAARYLFTSPEFLIEVYDCLGGYDAFANIPSLDELWDRFDRAEKTISTAVRAVVYLHHAVDGIGRPGFQFEPSLNKAFLVFKELKKPSSGYMFKEKYVSRSLLHARWSSSKETLALLYAASTIKVNRKTLLQIIVDGFLTYQDHRKFFDKWFARARYVCDHIFARMTNNKVELATRRVLGVGPIMPFRPPSLDSSEESCFRDAFGSYIKEKKDLVVRK